MISQDGLKEKLRYDPEAGKFFWLNKAGRRGAGSEAGVIHENGYVIIRIDGRNYRAHRLAWLYIHGRWPSADIDHKNCVRADNRLRNLREATRPQNLGNSRSRSDNTSGAKGVSWDKKRERWAARIGVTAEGKRTARHLGYFTELSDASAAYARAAKIKYGEFARPEG